MTDGQAAETPPGTPSRRALGAMESAVRRAREAQGGLPPAPPPRTNPAPNPQHRLPATDPTDQGRAQEPAHRRPDRWLLASVVAAAVLVVVAAAALGVSTSRNSQPAAPSPSRAAAAPARSAPRPGAAGTKGGGTSSTTTTTTAPATTTPFGAVGVPVISSLTPSSGTAGEGIQVAGANFLSSNGQIVATFNGRVAPTSCPAQNTCTLTVPPQSGPSSAQVSITTASGTSNAVTFTYG
jgi:IPT/TIG domain